eukprot:121331_1
MGVNRFIKSHKLTQIIFLSCHYDVISLIDNICIIDLLHKRISINSPLTCVNTYINPTNEYDFDYKEMFNQPQIRISLRQCPTSDFNPTFSKWHYLDHTIRPQALCLCAFITFNDKINGESEKKMVGFTCVKTANPFELSNKTRYQYSLHRTVVLPRYQGMGIGSRISEVFAEYLLRQKPSIILHSKTAHPFYGKNRGKNILWSSMDCSGKKSSLKNWNHSKNKKKNKLEKSDNKKPAKIMYSFMYNDLNSRGKKHLDKLKQRMIIVK